MAIVRNPRRDFREKRSVKPLYPLGCLYFLFSNGVLYNYFIEGKRCFYVMCYN